MNTITTAGPNNDLTALSEMAHNQSRECYGDLLKSGKHSDVVIRVSGGDDDPNGTDAKEFRVHKNILSQRSPVFSAMFDNDLEEAQKNVVNITDVKADVFEVLLRYVYCGEIEGIENYAMELLEVADKVTEQILYLIV